jgi:hypothetical protein
LFNKKHKRKKSTKQENGERKAHIKKICTYFADIIERRNACRILVEKTEERIPLARLSY